MDYDKLVQMAHKLDGCFVSVRLISGHHDVALLDGQKVMLDSVDEHDGILTLTFGGIQVHVARNKVEHVEIVGRDVEASMHDGGALTLEYVHVE